MKKIVVTAALAAILSGSVYAGGFTAMPTQAASNWTGFYIGANAGYTWSDTTTTFSPLPSATDFGVNPATLSETQSSVVVGGQIGYDWQSLTYPRFVFGMLTDLNYSGINGGGLANAVSSTGAPLPNNGINYFSDFHEITWFGTLRPRIGFLVSNNWLLYGTGGLAYGRMEENGNANVGVISSGSSTYPATKNVTKAGWVAGAGAEWKFAQRWSARAEYLYYDLGSASATGNATPATSPSSAMSYNWQTPAQVLTLGLNYRFNG